MPEEEDSDGVHPVVCVIVLVAITVTLAALLGAFVVNWDGGALFDNDECNKIDSAHVQSDGDILLTFTSTTVDDVEVTYTTQAGETDVQVVDPGGDVSVEVEANAAQNSTVRLRLYGNGWEECGEYA